MFVVHYGEIGLKGKNRRFFEKKLVENLKKQGAKKIEHLYGRILVDCKEEILSKTFGIVYFSPAKKSNLSLDEMKKTALSFFSKPFPKSFRIECKRENKKFPLTSPQIEKEIGAFIHTKTKIPVSLKNPEEILYMEVLQNFALIYKNKQKGLGGLPVGTGGKTLVFLSGGIDSPVASLLMNKRGTKNIFVSFLTKSTLKNAGNKIKKIVSLLSPYNLGAKLYLADISNFRKELSKADEKYRMLLFRRQIFRFGFEIAKKEKAKAFITGDSLAQVASQTLDNLSVILEASPLPVLSPLIGMDKEEIISLSKKYGLFDLCKTPCKDVCSSLSPKKPETHAKLKDILEQESKLSETSFSYDLIVF